MTVNHFLWNVNTTGWSFYGTGHFRLKKQMTHYFQNKKVKHGKWQSEYISTEIKNVQHLSTVTHNEDIHTNVYNDEFMSVRHGKWKWLTRHNMKPIRGHTTTCVVQQCWPTKVRRVFKMLANILCCPTMLAVYEYVRSLLANMHQIVRCDWLAV